MSFNRPQRKHIETLERRLDHLHERVNTYYGSSPSYDQSEAAALRWILRYVKEQEDVRTEDVHM